MVIGVSGIQGDFREHKWMIEKLGIETYVVRTPEDLEKVDGLIIPGGESTTMIRIMKRIGLFDALKEKIFNGFQFTEPAQDLSFLQKKLKTTRKSRWGL